MKRRIWLWLSLTLIATGVLGALAGFWNYNLVQNADLITVLKKFNIKTPEDNTPWFGIVLGSLGFVVVCTFFYLIFFKLLSEIRANQAQSEFLARVSHELKTPISTLELAGSLLKKDDLTPSERQALWTFFELELKRLKAEVDTLLSASVASERPFEINPERMDLRGWMKTQSQPWKAILGKDGELNFDQIDGGESVWIFSDASLLRLIFQNLFVNARKFAVGTPKVQMSLKVHGSENQNKKWMVSFRDTGLGFDPKDNKKIFKRFFRSTHNRQKNIPGTGLGLYLVKRTCDSLKIKVSAHSAGPNLGTEFLLEGSCL
jgi:signal transduction histidine kinase